MKAPDACDGSVRCITCSDALELVRLESTSSDGTLGICIDESGRRSEILLSLVPDSHAGDWLLAHAGVAMRASEGPRV
jgi:hydrogenase maturation factor